jgi:GWxTD domain-containing protein
LILRQLVIQCLTVLVVCIGFEAGAADTKQMASNTDSLVALGYAKLKLKDYGGAEKAFLQALKYDQTLPAAHVGLGLVFAEGPSRGVTAFVAFRKAVGAAKRATKLDSTYAPAYRLLGELYERFQEDHEKATGYYLKYVTLEKGDLDGLYYFGLACVRGGQYELVTTHLKPFLDTHPEAVRLLPLVAQGYFYQETYEVALAHFERYLSHIPETERAYYTDISMVASTREMEAYQALADTLARQSYLGEFWQRRDPDILTSINERVIEHYRRVWYARTFFAEKVTPWDRRGEVYIRYGEPDFRSRSNNRQFVMDPKVEAVRNRMAVDMYGPEATYLTFTGPVFPIRRMRRLDRRIEVQNGPNTGEDIEADENLALTPGEQASLLSDLDLEATSITDINGNPRSRLEFDAYGPVTTDSEFESVAWETWTYTELRGGVEFTFTDEVGNSVFDFAPMPPTPLGDNKLTGAARMMAYVPGVLYDKTMAVIPDLYVPGMGAEDLHFYYDLADFKGEDGQTVIEVYYGVPPKEVDMAKGDLGHLIQVQGSLALADEGHAHIYRSAKDFLYQNSEAFDTTKGSFVADALQVKVFPGTYQLQVQLKDLISGRVGVYKQNLTVTDFRSEDLQVSGILMASDVRDNGTNLRLKKRDVWITPMPSRAYADGGKVFAYFEIYNLKIDTFGQTRYKVRYQVQFNPGVGAGLAGTVSSGVRSLFNRKKIQVSVAYEQVGSDTTEGEYIELDLRKAKAGVNVLQVQVTDVETGQEASREVVFLYGNARKK